MINNNNQQQQSGITSIRQRLNEQNLSKDPIISSPQRQTFQIQIKPRKIDKKQNQETGKPITTYKSFLQVAIIASILSFNSTMFGYLFTIIATIPPSQLISAYHIPLSSGSAQGLVNGMLPIGGVIGSYVYPYYQKFLTRKTAIFPPSILVIIGTVLVMIPTFQTLIIGRIFCGISAGLLAGLTPFMIKDISPKELRATFGSFFNLARIIGIVICYAIALLLHFVFPSYGYLVIMGFLIFLALLQVFLVYFIVPESPGEMTMKKRFDELEKSVKVIYKPEYVQKIIQQYKDQYLFQASNTQIVDSTKIHKQHVDYSANKRRAFLVAIDIAFIRQFIGISTLVLYSGDIMNNIDPGLSIYTPIIINVMQLVAGILSTIFLVNLIGRRNMILIGLSSMCIFNFVIGIGCFFKNQIVVLVFMILAMISFAGTFNPPSWSYPIQITPPEQITYTTVTNWVSMLIVSVIPPIVTEHMPGQNPYPIFFFFGGSCFFSFIHMYFYAIEIKGLTYQKILQKI